MFIVSPIEFVALMHLGQRDLKAGQLKIVGILNNDIVAARFYPVVSR